MVSTVNLYSSSTKLGESEMSFKVGQTVWWLNDSLREVHEAIVTEVIVPEFGLRRDKRWQIKLSDDGMRIIGGVNEIYSAKKDAYEAGFARIARMIKVANKRLDDALGRRARLILSENLSLRQGH
jgi:hypothetical protein